MRNRKQNTNRSDYRPRHTFHEDNVVDVARATSAVMRSERRGDDSPEDTQGDVLSVIDSLY